MRLWGDKKLGKNMTGIDSVFLVLSDHLLPCLTVRDMSDMAWVAWTSFFKYCSAPVILEVLEA